MSVRQAPFGLICRVFVGLALLTTVAACSNVDLTAAKALSQVGVAASTGLRNDAVAVQQRVRDYPAREALIVGLMNPGASPPPGLANLTQTLDGLLSARTRMFGQLVAVYTSFGDLAAYNAGGSVAASTGSFVDASNGFIAAVNQAANKTLSPVNINVAAIGADINVGIADEALKRKVQTASVAIRTALGTVVPALEAEMQYSLSLRRVIDGQGSLLRTALVQNGLAQYKQTTSQAAADVVNAVGLQPAADIDTQLSDPDGTAKRQAFETYIAASAAAQGRDAANGYAAQVELLQELIRQHEQLEAGVPIGLQTLQDWVGRVQTILTKLQN
jgi:hypothetical protein